MAIRPSGVWRILRRLELNRLPASQRYKPHNERWKRYEKQLPGHRVQVDVKFIEPIGGSRQKHYGFRGYGVRRERKTVYEPVGRAWAR